MPDAAWAVSVHPPSLSRRKGQPPVLTSSNRISTLLQRFACARPACGGLRSAPDCRPRRTFLHLSYSCATPFGPAILVTQDPSRTWASQRSRLKTSQRKSIVRRSLKRDIVPRWQPATIACLPAAKSGSSAAQSALSAIDAIDEQIDQASTGIAASVAAPSAPGRVTAESCRGDADNR
jgi:hypothetical protein